MRITNFQLDHQGHIRRDYAVRYGGCCSCFPTCGRRLRFKSLISFENKVRQSSLPKAFARDSLANTFFYEDEQSNNPRDSKNLDAA